ncbi:DUF928 domain-containing protein [Anabaena azotica]|uniref:DUF928 domain-containing protein n=1 Tax=Anabaena azotica TaxID=197653 RepID=UPI0039A5421B
MMNFQKYINTVLKIVVGLSPALIILSNFCLPTLAQSTSSPKPPQQPDRDSPGTRGTAGSRFGFPSTSGRGAPSIIRGGARRGNSCVTTKNEKLSLTALMPTWNNEGQTVSENPNLYVYVPKTTSKLGEFLLIDDKGNEVYQTNFIPPEQAGIVQVSIPATAALKIGKKYQWYFTIICNSEDRSQDEYVSGLLERTTLGSLLNLSLQQAVPLQRAEIYAKNKIWYDTISNIAPFRQENPEAWAELLSSVGLEQFINEPFVELGTAKP